MELEDRKILNKRKKRKDKIEETVYNLEEFFASKKRFRPSPNQDSTSESDHHPAKFELVEKGPLLQKILQNYLSELPLHNYT